MKNYANFIIKPVISEKSFSEAKNDNKYTFVVARYATKTDVKNAVEALFGVSVKSVYTTNVKGSKTRNTKTRRIVLDDTYKKARVLLPKGQRINIFEEGAEEKKEGKKKEAKGK